MTTKPATGRVRTRRKFSVYPITVIRLEDGSLHACCAYCMGSGKETIWTSSSNSPGTSRGQPSGKDCYHCGGTGYEFMPLTVTSVRLHKDKRGRK